MPSTNQRANQTFLPKNAMDITGLGGTIVDQLLDHKKIQTVADLYALSHDDLISLDRFGEKSAKNILRAIKKSKTKPMPNIIIVSIPFIGDVSAQLIANHYPTLERFLNAKEDDLLTIDQIGPKMVDAIKTFQSSKTFRLLIESLIQHGLNPKDNKIKRHQSLVNKTFVITGTLNQPRSTIESLIKEHGGRIMKSVGKKTNYLILGNSPGKKHTDAMTIIENGGTVEIISETHFLDMINGHQR